MVCVGEGKGWSSKEFWVVTVIKVACVCSGRRRDIQHSRHGPVLYSCRCSRARRSAPVVLHDTRGATSVLCLEFGAVIIRRHLARTAFSWLAGRPLLLRAAGPDKVDHSLLLVTIRNKRVDDGAFSSY